MTVLNFAFIISIYGRKPPKIDTFAPFLVCPRAYLRFYLTDLRDVFQKVYILLQDAVHFVITLQLHSLPIFRRKTTKVIDFVAIRSERVSSKKHLRFIFRKYE